MQQDTPPPANNETASPQPIIASISTEPVVQAPNIWQRIAYWSIFPAVLLAPAWLAIGRGFLGAGGWLFFYTIPAAAVIFLPFQLALMILTLVTKKRYLTRWSSISLYTYYVALIVLEISLVDGGDTQESLGSVLTFWGVPDILNAVIFSAAAIVVASAMIALVVFLVIDVARIRKAKRINASSKPTVQL